MRSLIDTLRNRNELVVVKKEVDPLHELAAVTRAVQHSSNSTVLFEKVRGYDMPVVTNIYNNRPRLCELLSVDERAFCPTWLDLHEQVKSGQIEDTVADERPSDLVECKLSDLPQITYHEKDCAPYFTSAVFLAKNPDTGVENLSFNRCMYISDDELRVRLGPSHDLYAYQKIAEDRGEYLEAAMLIGASPGVIMAGGSSLPRELSETTFAAAFEKKPLDRYPGKSVDLMIPADTEIVVEGRFIPNEKRTEGPFGEFLGYYVGLGENHVFEILNVYTRPNPMFHALLCGSAEDLSILEAVEAAKTYRYLTERFKGIVDVSCAPTALNTTIKIEQQYEGHSTEVLQAALSDDLKFNDFCAVVDEDVDIFDMNDVIWAYMGRRNKEARVSIHSQPTDGAVTAPGTHAGRVGLDATVPYGKASSFLRKKIPGEANINLANYL